MAEENKLRNIGSEERNAISKKTTKAKKKKKNKGTVIFKGIVIGLIFLMLFAEGAGLYYLAHHTKKIKRTNEALQQKVTNLETYVNENVDKESMISEKRRVLDLVSPINAVSHRGYNIIAPENTLPAFALSKENGFNAVEADVCFTKDDIPVMIHDYEISRTSNGSGDIRTLTFEEVRKYDFGIKKDEEYKGTQIPSFEEFIDICKKMGLKAYIHLKDAPVDERLEERIDILVNIVKKYDMEEYVTWLDNKSESLELIAESIPDGRFGLLIFEDDYEKYIEKTKDFQEKNPESIVFLAASYEYVTEENILLVMKENIPLEVFCIDDEQQMLELHPYISGVISNKLSVSEVFYNDIID